ncbi:hypothetical protein HY990_03450 [Candidatus Micrarchaeota archaeon]|nr:hypothetical protein [Candidatus Micrarchaeota archaeon]
MERKISYEVYAIAFVLSAFTFLIGIFLGGLTTNSNFSGISTELSNVSSRVDSLKVLLLFDGNSSSFCPLYISELSDLNSEIERVGYKLTYIEDVKQAQDIELKKKYFLLEAESYLLSQKAKNFCSDKSILLINFYSNKACESCKQQGSDILRVRDELHNQNISLKLFSFDGDLGSSVADAFAREYGVNSYPSVVINGKTYSGPIAPDRLGSLVRSAYYENRSSGNS